MDLFSAQYPFVFCSLASGSNGNCYYIGNGEEGILVDVGISLRSIRKRLSEIGVGISRIKAVFVTHDHTDHIKGLAALTMQQTIQVFASTETIMAIQKNPDCHGISADCLFHLNDRETVKLAGLGIENFSVSHDAPGASGYYIRNSHNSITIATDLGYISEKVAGYLKKSTIVVIESNYDEEMLQKSRYPRYLRERISGGIGHLSNRQTSDFLADHIAPHMSHIFLCHLSKENNHPELALKTLEHTLRQRGKSTDTTLIRALPRGARTEPFYFS